MSTRLVACVLWLFTLIVVSSYTANLAACLTIETPISLIDDVTDLALEKGGVKYGAKRKGSTRNFFQVSMSNISTYGRIKYKNISKLPQAKE